MVCMELSVKASNNRKLVSYHRLPLGVRCLQVQGIESGGVIGVTVAPIQIQFGFMNSQGEA